MYFLYPEESTVDRIIQYFEPRMFAANEVVWRQGRASVCAILVMEGRVESELEDEAGTKTMMGVGYLLGEYGLMNNRVWERLKRTCMYVSDGGACFRRHICHVRYVLLYDLYDVFLIQFYSLNLLFCSLAFPLYGDTPTAQWRHCCCGERCSRAWSTRNLNWPTRWPAYVWCVAWRGVAWRGMAVWLCVPRLCTFVGWLLAICALDALQQHASSHGLLLAFAYI